MTATIMYDGRLVTLHPYRIGRHDTDPSTPLACGHRHVSGDVVWENDFLQLAWCGRCVTVEETTCPAR